MAPEWAVLKPSWFMQNFIGLHPHARSIHAEGILYTATGDGRVAFIDASDIAEVAARLLVDDAAPNQPLVLTGPEALSYDDIARSLSAAIGKPVRHERIDESEATRRWITSGIPSSYATWLASLDVGIRNGAENRVTDTVLRIVGRAPRSFNDFLRLHC